MILFRFFLFAFRFSSKNESVSYYQDQRHEIFVFQKRAQYPDRMKRDRTINVAMYRKTQVLPSLNENSNIIKLQTQKRT